MATTAPAMGISSQVLKPSDRCDRCGSPAMYRWLFRGGNSDGRLKLNELLLCGKHTAPPNLEVLLRQSINCTRLVN